MKFLIPHGHTNITSSIPTTLVQPYHNQAFEKKVILDIWLIPISLFQQVGGFNPMRCVVKREINRHNRPDRRDMTERLLKAP